MESKTHLYIIILVLLAFIVAMLLGTFDRGNVKFGSEIIDYFANNEVVAAIGVDEKGNLSMVSRTGKPAKICELNPKAKNPCKGIEKGLLSSVTITLLETEGSFCYARIHPNGLVEQICWPET